MGHTNITSYAKDMTFFLDGPPAGSNSIYIDGEPSDSNTIVLPELSKTAGVDMTGVPHEFTKLGMLSPIKIFAELNERYERSWWDWEPETIYQSLYDDFGAEGTPEELRNIIGSLQILVNTNFAQEEWHIFEKVGHAFNLNSVMFQIVQPLELDEIAKAIKVIRTIRPKDEFETEVCGYIAACAKNSGVVYLPEELFPGCGQEFLDNMNNNTALRDEVRAAWPRDPEPNDSLALKVQLLRLHEIREAVNVYGT